MQGRESGLSFAAASELTVAAVPRRKLVGAGSVRPHAGSRYDRYELIHPIGEGGMGTVWLARMRGEHGFERVVALKVLLPSFVRDLRYRNMFIDEARIASRVVHANVAQVIDLGEKDGNLYLVMEWVNGDSLGNLLRAATAQNRTVPLTVLLRIFADVCAGLHAAHDLRDQRGQPLNVVHRDVSPQNILVTDAGTVKVIDFGVVKARGRIAEDTNPGVVKGKLHYMAPERAIGAEVDRRADIWTVGAILYRILAGRAASDADGNPALIWALVLRDQLEPLPSNVPVSIARVVMKAVARDPKDRYASAAELQGELEQVLHSLSDDSPTTSGDVAAFVAAVLGQSLAERRAAIERALDGEDQTATLHFLRPHIALVPPPAQQAADGVLQRSPFQRKELPPIRSLPVSRSTRPPAPVTKQAFVTTRRAVRALAVSAVVSRLGQRAQASRAPSAASVLARVRGRARHLPVLCAVGGLSLLALVLSNHLGPRFDAKPGWATASARPGAPAQLHAADSARAQGIGVKRLPEPTAVNVDDLALESELVSASSEHSRPAPLWKNAWASRPSASLLLGFQPARVQTLAPAISSVSPLLASPASPAASSKVEPQRVRPSFASQPPPALAKLADADAASAKAKADTTSIASFKCNPPYAFDRNGRKKFRPECF